MTAYAEFVWNDITSSANYKIPSTDQLWSSIIPEETAWLPEPSDILYKASRNFLNRRVPNGLASYGQEWLTCASVKCILTALPRRYRGLIYETTPLPYIYADFLADANDAPVLRVAAIMGVLGKLASDGQIDDGVRGKIDRDKTDTLFWQIIGQQQPVDAKTSSGTGWSPTGFMISLPAQMQRVLDDCHLLANKLK
jgi:hypothetical protein